METFHRQGRLFPSHDQNDIVVDIGGAADILFTLGGVNYYLMRNDGALMARSQRGFYWTDTNGLAGGTSPYISLRKGNSVDYITISDDATGTTVNAFGGIQIGDDDGGNAQPTCDATTRGLFWLTEGGASVADAVEVCAKNSSDAYAWVALATIS